MSCEVRMIKPGWRHPEHYNEYRRCSEYRGLMTEYTRCLARWEEGYAKWQEGLQEDWMNSTDDVNAWKPLEDENQEWTSEKPDPNDYMPEWTPGEATLYVMYETTSEGTPISPGFVTLEELASWLAKNRASAVGGTTATYAQWLTTCKQGWAPTGVMLPSGNIITGVEFNDLPS